MSGQPEDGRFLIEVDGRAVQAEPGQTLAAALLGAGILTFRRTQTGRPRGVFCGMGVCFDCLVTVDGQAEQRACMTVARPGMRVETGAPPRTAPSEASRVRA